MKSTKLVNALVDQLMDMGMPLTASSLEEIYQSDRFTKIDHLTFLSELIEKEYQDKVSKRLNNRLRAANLINCPQELTECRNSSDREYLPTGITERLSDLSFIKNGMNLCILGASDSGKTYLAKAIGIKACLNYRVLYTHCGAFLEALAALKAKDHEKYSTTLKKALRMDLIILDDFLLHTVNDEDEVKILFTILEGRTEAMKSTIICSQRDPRSWKSMIMNDEVSTNAIMKRVTKHYTVAINYKVE
jgi:DNA replication protein DnaC